MRSNIEDIRASVLTKIDNIPAIVLSKVDNIWVFEKTAKFSIRDHVSFVATACWDLRASEAFYAVCLCEGFCVTQPSLAYNNITA